MATLSEYKENLDFIRQLYTALSEDYTLRLQGKPATYGFAELGRSTEGLGVIQQRLQGVFTKLQTGKAAAGSILPPKSPARVKSPAREAPIGESYLFNIQAGDTAVFTPELKDFKNPAQIEFAEVKYNAVTGVPEARIVLDSGAPLQGGEGLSLPWKPAGPEFEWKGDRNWLRKGDAYTTQNLVRIDFNHVSPIGRFPVGLKVGDWARDPSLASIYPRGQQIRSVSDDGRTIQIGPYSGSKYTWSNQLGWTSSGITMSGYPATNLLTFQSATPEETTRYQEQIAAEKQREEARAAAQAQREAARWADLLSARVNASMGGYRGMPIR